MGYDVPLSDPRFGHIFRCKCKAAEDVAEMQKICGLTEQERALRLTQIDTTDRPGTTQMVHECKFFVSNPSGILTLWGGVGNGKTMCLQAVVNECIERGVQAVYVTAFDLFSHIREAFNSQREVISESAYNRLSKFEMVRILAIDELDKVRPTDWIQEQLTDLVDKRHRRGLDGTCGTLIAMNSDPSAQTDWIASRLRDGRNKIIHNTDSDIRPLLKG